MLQNMEVYYFRKNVPLKGDYTVVNTELESRNANVRFGPALIIINGNYVLDLMSNQLGLYTPEMQQEKLRGGTISLETALAIIRREEQR